MVRALWRSCAATAAQPTAFLLAKDIQAARTQPLRIAFTCPRKLDNQLRDCVAGIRGDGDRRGGRLLGASGRRNHGDAAEPIRPLA